MTDGFDAIFAALDELERRIKTGAISGLREGAAEMQADAQGTSAYVGQSGATRASTVAYVATAEDNGDSAGQEAYQKAAEALTGFSGHKGKPLLVSAGTVGADEVKVVLTAPTDYLVHLEVDNGGEKAFIGPTLDAHAQNLTAAAARGIAAELSR